MGRALWWCSFAGIAIPSTQPMWVSTSYKLVVERAISRYGWRGVEPRGRQEEIALGKGIGFVSTDRAAAMLGCSANTVRRRIEGGEIPGQRIRRGAREVYRVPLSYLVLESRQIEPDVVRFWREQWAEVVAEVYSESLQKFREDLHLAEELGREKAAREAAESEAEALRKQLVGVPAGHLQEFGAAVREQEIGA